MSEEGAVFRPEVLKAAMDRWIAEGAHSEPDIEYVSYREYEARKRGYCFGAYIPELAPK